MAHDVSTSRTRFAPGSEPHPEAGPSRSGSATPRRFFGSHDASVPARSASSVVGSRPQSRASRRRRKQLPPGCTRGPEYVLDSEGQPQLYSPTTAEAEVSSDPHASPSKAPGPAGTLIWVDFPPSDPGNPFAFSRRRKLAIVVVAIYFTGITAYATSTYSIGIPSMCRELGCSQLQGAAGLALYAWGFGIAPLVLAPLSEEYGRKWSYITAVVVFTVLHLMMTLGKNIGTILIGRFLLGGAGSLGATLVGGTISDIYIPEERGLPMAMFGFMAMFWTGLGPVAMSWVEARPDLGWRWIQWIEMILIGAYLPLVPLILTETRAPVIIRRRAAKMRKEHAAELAAEAEAQAQGVVGTAHDVEKDEELAERARYRFTARAEVGRVKFRQAMTTSLMRPLLFLAVEPIVTFFSVWISLAWGVFYTQVQGLPYIYPTVYGFSTTQTGLIYLTMCIGSALGFALNFVQEAVYRRKVAKHGVEARLYAPMAGGVALFLGCMLYAFTVQPGVHWIVPAVAITIIIASVLTLYITGFVYLSECYGSYASSALAAMSFLRNMFGGAFTMFTEDMYITLTPRWAIFLMGVVAGILGIVPFVAFWKGPQIRARSRFSRVLMEEERRRVEVAERERKDKERDEEEDAADAEAEAEAEAAWATDDGRPGRWVGPEMGQGEGHGQGVPAGVEELRRARWGDGAGAGAGAESGAWGRDAGSGRVGEEGEEEEAIRGRKGRSAG